MKGSLIVRLVDITLLLLLSLMAAASFTTTGPEPPVTHKLTDEGVLLLPLQIGIGEDGSIYTREGSIISLEEMQEMVDTWSGPVEFIADADAPAGRLLAVHAVTRRLERQAAFQVKQVSP